MPPKYIRKHGRWPEHAPSRSHRFEHWCVDDQVYFITARTRDGFPAFSSERAKLIFWDRFNYYSAQAGFEPWITTIVENHYHTLGYLTVGNNLKTMMQRIHGSVAKLVNDVLESEGLERRVKFWRDAQGHEYFDGCIRDETQLRRAYRYTQIQSERHGICSDWKTYLHTRALISIEDAVKLAHERNGLMPHVPYKRYEK